MRRRELTELGAELKSMLAETAAYRNYFKTTKNTLSNLQITLCFISAHKRISDLLNFQT